MRAQSRDAALRSVAWVAAIALALLAGEPALADTPLAGRVLDGEGHPTRRASVFIYTATVRSGTSSLCPSCYPDCGKSAVADREGRFSIPALNDSLLFRVLVVARGWDPVFVERVDPTTGPVEFRLARRRLARPDPHRSLRGRVLDPLGRPVVGATLTPYGYRRDTGKDAYTMRFGGLIGTDPLSVTDEQGRFVLALGDSGVRWFIRVRARSLAPLQLHEQPAGAREISIRMGHGATVTGRLLHEGQPLPGVAVGLAQVERAAQHMAYGHDEIATDGRGVFTFLNVTPGEDYFVHGKMESLGRFGALDTTRVHVRGEDSFARVGDLRVGPGRRVAGRVVLSDGQPVPPGTRLLLALEHAWDAQNQTLAEDGRFDLRGVPPGHASLMVRVKGYRFARESTGYTEARGLPECEVGGEGDLEGLTLVLEREEHRLLPGPGPPPKP